MSEMKDKLLKVWNNFFVLSWLPIILIAIPSFLFVAATLYFKTFPMAVEIFAYGLSGYSLIISVTGIVRVGSRIKSFIQNLSLWKLFSGDVRLRTKIMMVPGLAINGIYVISNIALGIMNHASWFIYLGIYYLYLVVAKGQLLHNLVVSKNTSDYIVEYRKYRNCGINLLLLNIVLAAESVYIVYKNQNYHYQGWLIYAMAAVTFYNLIMSVINAVRFRKFNSPVLSAVKAVNLTTAMVTLLALETAMISQFGDAGEENFRRIMVTMTAGCICLIEFGMGIYMIRRGNKNLRELRQQNK